MKMRLPSAVGLSSVLVILAVLCLSTFSLLSVSTVRADGRLAEKSRQATLNYYAADACAEALLSQLRHGNVPEGVTCENGIYRYSCAISDTQVLTVAVTLSGSDYQILQWQAQSVTHWQADEKLHVFTPGE